MVKIAGMVKWFKSYGLLFFIIAIGFGLRFINLREWFHFEFDEEVIAWKLRQFVEFGKPFLIGGGTPFGFHLGPAFYYLSAIPLFFSRLDPIGWGVAAAVFGTITVWLMWLVGKSLFNSRVGLIAALLWATSFTAVMTDRHWWPLVLDPALSLLVILSLFKIESSRTEGCQTSRSVAISSGLPRRCAPRNDVRWWVILGFTLAFAWQADLTVLPLFLAAGVVAVLNFRRQWKGILVTVGILIVSFSPLVFFELRHPGANLGQLIFSFKRSHLLWLEFLEFLKTITFVPAVLGKLLFPVSHLDGNLLKFYSWCREVADGRVNGQPWWAGGVTTLVLLIPFFSSRHPDPERSRRGRILSGFFAPSDGTQNDGYIQYPAADKTLRLTIISGVAGILAFKLFGGNLYDFYLAVLYPVVLLLTAGAVDFIWRKWGKIVAIAGLGVIVGLNLFTISKAYHSQGLAVKRQAVTWSISNTGKEGFDLESISNCSRYNGIRYLFLLDGKEPRQSFVDQDLSWLYDKNKKGDFMKPKYLVTFVTPDDLTPDQNKKYNQLKLNAVDSKIFTPSLEVIISQYD